MTQFPSREEHMIILEHVSKLMTYPAFAPLFVQPGLAFEFIGRNILIQYPHHHRGKGSEDQVEEDQGEVIECIWAWEAIEELKPEQEEHKHLKNGWRYQ